MSLAALLASLSARRNVTVAEQLAGVPDLLHREYINREFLYEGSMMTLREARVRAAMEDPAAFREQVLTVGTFENRLAYEMSLALEHVGIMVLAGAIPLPLVLAMCGAKIVEDWATCVPLVEDIRGRQAAVRPSDLIPWHRRHGEWLACAAAIYLRSTTSNAAWINLAEQTLGDPGEIRRKERELRHAERDLMPPVARRAIKKLVRNWHRQTVSSR